jgi:peptidoglycan/LPS O-acetylase OafA/YrhL
MLQRIQSLYLLGAIVSSGILPFLFYLWKDSNGFPSYFASHLMIAVMFGFSTALSLLGLSSYKKRQQQFVVGLFNIALNVILLGLLVFYSIILPGEHDVSEKGIGLFLPLVSIVLLILANRAVKKDEKLVKSSNRIR